MNQSGEAPPRRWYSSIVRLWYLVVFWAVALVIGVVAVIVVVPTQYQASGQLLILPPAQPLGEGERRNTYLFLPDGLVQTSLLIANSVNTPDVARELEEDGFTSTYTVGVVPGTGPLITITVKDVDPAQALALRDEMLERLEGELDRIQTAEEVPAGQLMEPRRFNNSDQAEQLAGSRIRAIVAIVVACAVLAVLSVTEVDRRTSRRATAGEPQPSPPSEGQRPVQQPQPSVEGPARAAPAPQNNELDGLLSLLANLPAPQPGASDPYGHQPPPAPSLHANGNGNGYGVHPPQNAPVEAAADDARDASGPR